MRKVVILAMVVVSRSISTIFVVNLEAVFAYMSWNKVQYDLTVLAYR